jgi:hypothetical protein
MFNHKTYLRWSLQLFLLHHSLLSAMCKQHQHKVTLAEDPLVATQLATRLQQQVAQRTQLAAQAIL